MIDKIKRWWQEFLFYAKRPDMRLFWLFFALAIIIVGVNFTYMPRPVAVMITFVLAVVALVIFINNYRLSKANFTVELERSQFRGMIISLHDGVIAYDANFKILVFNEATESMFGIKAEKMIGNYFTPQMANEDKWRRLAQVMFPSLAPVVVSRSEVGEFPQIVDISLSDPTLELRVTTVKVLNEKGQVLGFMKIIHDRTREVEAARSKSEFVTVAAHQLRTPLNAVSWTFETLVAEGSIPEEFKELARNGRMATAKLLKTVNDLLDVAKIEEGRFGYQLEATEMVGFMENLLAQKMIAAKQYGIKVYFERPKEKSLVLKVDARKLMLAIENIIDNAIRYNVQNGEVTVKMQRVTNDPYLMISVTDTGVGIPTEEISKLFSKFFRASNVLKYKTEGTGLGLYISKNIIRQHGGQVWAESTLNRGTTIYLTLPTDHNLVPVREVFVEE